MRIKIISLVILLALSTLEAQQKSSVTGFFSDMHYIPDAGDVIGTEIWIVYARGGYYATIQEAEGEPDPPVTVPIEVSGSRVKFTIKKSKFVTNYVGSIGNAGLSLSIAGNAPRLLKRRSSYWQR